MVIGTAEALSTMRLVDAAYRAAGMEPAGRCRCGEDGGGAPDPVRVRVTPGATSPGGRGPGVPCSPQAPPDARLRPGDAVGRRPEGDR